MAPNVTKASQLRPNPNMVDPDVKIPEAVRRAAEAAEAAQRAAYPDQVPQPAPKAKNINPDQVSIADPSDTPPTPPTPPQSVEPPKPPQQVTPQGNEPTPPTPPAEDSWEHKFKSEAGRRARLEQLLSQANDRMAALEGMIQDIKSAPPPAPPAPPAPARLVTEQEENEFGPEMLDVMGRRAREIVSPELLELRATVQSLEQKLNGTVTRVTRNARQDMLGTLDTKMPDWRNVNNLEEFKAWLALPDPYFGVNRHSALLQAFEQNDTPRVLNFFKGFVSELAAGDPAQEPQVNVPPAEPQPVKPSLETLAAPGRARTPAQQNAPAEKQIITTADINAFYAAKARGAYNGREAEFAQLEQELFKAQREGRVRAV